LQDSPLILNLASKEYSKAVEPFIEEHTQFVTCTFASLDKNGKWKTKATEAKIARGEMVRYLAQHDAQSLDVVKSFTGRNFTFKEELSSEKELFFGQE